MSEHSKKWDRKETYECECHKTHPYLEKEIQYKILKKRLAEEKARLARKVKEPNDRYQTSLDNFLIDR